jgi:hypothetical protein
VDFSGVQRKNRHNKKTDGTSVRKNIKNKNSGSEGSNFTDAFVKS